MRRLALPLCALCLTLCVALTQEVCAMNLYVAPDGKDTWSGGVARPTADGGDGPLATLGGARDVIRKLKARGPLVEPVTVIVAEGEYALTRAVSFGAVDSGTDACPITYAAAPGAKPVFTAGRAITGWQPGPDGVWTAQVPEVAAGKISYQAAPGAKPQVAAGKWYFEQLWVDGRRATRARTPNKFYSYVLTAVDRGLDPATGQQGDLTGRAFKARKEDFAPLLSVPRDRISDVTLVTYHSWETTRSRLAGIDPATRTVVTTAPIPWGFGGWGNNCRYHLENLRAALDQPGEWFLDRDGTLSYMPRPGEDMAKVKVVAPSGSGEFLSFSGDGALGLPVEHLTLRGLSFQHAQYILPPEGHGDGQAEITVPAVITLDGARNVTFEGCEVKHIGTWGMWFRHGCKSCKVTRTYFEDLGAGGVKIGEGGVPADPGEQTGGIICDNNIIHTGGRIHHGCIGVWIGHSGGNQVTHNDISDLYYTGVSVGWTWGYSPTISHNNHIDFNHICHLGQGVLSDMGGVYTLGNAEGTTVNNNVIHDVHDYGRYGRGGWGLYNDEGTAHILMQDNLVYNTKTGGYHQHYGEYNTIRNNIFAFSMDGQLQRSRVEDRMALTFSTNIVYWKGGELYTAGNWERTVTTDHNLFWNAGGEPVRFHGNALEQWQAKGHEAGSLVADPLFVDADHYDFHLRPGSPALKLGFKEFDTSQAGLYGDPAWTAIPKGFQYAPVEFAPLPPPPPPMQVNDDFEGYPVGAQPRGAQCNVENRGDSIAVTDETAASGKHSLKIQDAPGLQNIFDPHLVYSPNHASGTTTCSFDMRLGERVIMYHEWRSWDLDPYRVGPTFWIRDNKLVLFDQPVLDLPLNQWFHVEVSAKVGRQADGKWDLVVTLPGQEPKRFQGLHVGDPTFRNLTWIGWSSMANEKTVFYLDNLRITNSEWREE